MNFLQTLTKEIEANKKKPKSKLSDLIIVVYGDKKVGKSTFCSRFEAPFFLDCEDALKGIYLPDGSRPSQVQIHAWPRLMEITNGLKNTNPKEFGHKTIVIDGLNEAYTRLRDKVLSDFKVKFENEGELGYGKGASLIRDQWRQWFLDLRAVSRQGFGVVLTGHESTISFESNGVTYNKRVPYIDGSKTEKAWDVIKPAVDMVIHAYKHQDKDGLKHMMRLKGNQLVEAASTLESLPDVAPFSYQLLEKEYLKGN